MTDQPVSKAFVEVEQEHRADSFGMWVFLATETMLIGAIFVAYFIIRLKYHDAFAGGSHELSLPIGTANTAILLTSSLAMAVGAESAGAGTMRFARRALWVTVLLGLAFLGLKAFEYWNDVREGLLPLLAPYLYHGPDPLHAALFFNIYLMMTGIHAVHLVIGVCLVAFLALPSRLPPERQAQRMASVGLYWHFVDVVWVFLFPLLYLVK
jgi:cytochrome c oxidase subunit 3